LYRAEATENTFDGAIDKVRDELDAELSRAKDKQVTLDKDAGRELKAQLLN
jgi:ribosome-associated translation inhibitor RaiA